MHILVNGVGDGRILRSGGPGDEDDEVGQGRAGRDPHGDDVGRLAHVGGADDGAHQRRERVRIDGAGGQVGRVDGVGKGGRGGYAVEYVVDLRPGAFLGVGGNLFRRTAISFPRGEMEGDDNGIISMLGSMAGCRIK